VVHSYACQTLSTRLLPLPTDNGRVKLSRTPISSWVFVSALSFAAARSLSRTFPLYLCSCTACCDARPLHPASFTRSPHSLLRRGKEPSTDTRHVLSTSLARHTYPLARSHTRTRTHAPTLALAPTPHTTMVSTSPRWLLSRDESIGQKFEEVMNNNPLGASVRAQLRQSHREDTDTAQG
jgi:hypothetical protein